MHPPGIPDHEDLERSTEVLLASGGDSRHTLLVDGRNKYGNRYSPEPDVMTFGSCTSSTLSAEAFAAASRLHGWLGALDDSSFDRAFDDLCERVRAELTSNIAMWMANHVDVVLTPSGTDAELVPLTVMLERGRPVTSILVGATEAGSGTARAAAGRHFDEVTPNGATVSVGDLIDPWLADRVTTTTVAIREHDGTPRDEADVDAEVRGLAEEAIDEGRSVLVHVIAHSKTGVHAPSLTTADDLAHNPSGYVGVVVDAAQGRFSRRGLHESLQRGFMVMTTGSKFFGGPPFAGAVLLPHTGGNRPHITRFPPGFSDYFVPSFLPRHWVSARASLAPRQNVGLLLRWWAALEEIRSYYSVPTQLRYEVLRRFQHFVPKAIARHERIMLRLIDSPLQSDGPYRLLESNITVFPFTCARSDGSLFEIDSLRSAQRLMRARPASDPRLGRVDRQIVDVRAELGQPVTIAAGPPAAAVLRLALGARQIVRTCVVSQSGKTFQQRLDALEADVDRTFAKLSELLAILEET